MADSEAVEAVAAAPLHVGRMDLEVAAGGAESLLGAGSILGWYLPGWGPLRQEQRHPIARQEELQHQALGSAGGVCLGGQERYAG